MTDSWGRPSVAEQGGAGPAPRPVGDRRAAGRRAEAPGGPRATALVPLLLLGLPVLGAVLSGGATGVVFTVFAALGAAAAAVVGTRPGLWWVVTATPVVVLLVALAASALASGGASGSAALATHALAWTAHAFTPVAVATAAALLVTVVRAARGAGGKGNGRD
jgi:hypothetical protein